jgi:predicted transcriptional regulator
METLHVYPSEAQEQAVIAFLEAQDIPFTREHSLPPHVRAGIENGLEDVKAGRTITMEEFQRRRSLVK